MVIGKALRAYREKHGISLRELARILAIDHTTLYRFEAEKDIEADSFVKILTLMLCDAPKDQQAQLPLCKRNNKKSKSAVPASPA